MKPMRHLGQLLCHISLLAFTTRRISALAPACTRTAASSHASIPPDVMHFPAHHSHRLLHSRSIVSRSSIHLSSSRSSTNEEFNEAAYESDRVAQDAMAMAAMKSQAEQEYAKLRTPWKWRIRKAVWDFLEEKDIAQYPRPVHHRIPNFLGADEAAKSLATLPEFQNANLVKVNPDTPQRKVRHFVLESGKTLLTPQPRLRTGFFSTLSTNNVPPDVPIEALTTSKGAAQHGTPVSLYESYNVDLVVVGSTAVCPNTGARVGKGEGFAELEWGILTQQGNLDASKVLVVTTVHDCQVLDETGEEEPWMSLLKKMKEEDGTEEVAATTPFGTLTQHDVPVDIIVTPTRIIRVPNRLPKPSGVFWDLLSPQKLSQIRVLQELKKRTEEELGHKLPSGPDEILPPIAERGRRGGRGRGGRGRSSGRGRGRMSGRGGNKDKR
ncbi:hypothetical protein HJC23_007501 [Cyclotella cryptica]|uniref:5-formyltetrahydrofolate cyclo-ligase n=1 Tax=Cyclotella cryptica TaxID=29204 RepID=A0ABD3PVN1_9STRA